MAVEFQPIIFGRSKGVDNKHDLAGLDYLSVGVNVDIDANNKIRRRRGHNVILSGDIHSLWSNGDICLFIEGGNLKRLHSDLQTVEVLAPVKGPCAYLSAIGKVYVTDGSSGLVIEDGVARKWGVDSPPPPDVAPATGGMRAGRYGVCLTHVMPDGRESGASTPVFFEGSGGIAVSGITHPPSGFVRVYVTPPDGDTFFRVAELRNGEATVTYTGATSDIPLRFPYLSPPPAGHMLCYFNGRIYIAVGNLLYYTEAYQPERCDIGYSFFRMNGRITMLMPVKDGLWVSDGQIWFLQGSGPEEFSKMLKAPYNAVEGTACRIDGKYVDTPGDGVIVTTEMGICVCGNGGSFKNETEDRVAFAAAKHGAGLVRRHDGMVQYLGIVNGDDGRPVNTYNPQVGQIEYR